MGWGAVSPPKPADEGDVRKATPKRWKLPTEVGSSSYLDSKGK